jgi:Domain of unknown function (DU1801)
MATAKTQPTDASIDAYIASRATESQAADCRTLMALLAKLTGEQARMWGPSIVGFSSYRYTYESGRSGESCATGFAIRGKDLVIYLVAESDDQASLLGRLGKHKMGKACLYVERLADLDLAVLEQLVANSLQALRLRYPQA